MKPLLACNLGLGDAIIMAGAAVVLAERHGGLLFPCWTHNYTSVAAIFIDHPEIEVISIENDLGFRNHMHLIPCGHYHSRGLRPGKGFDEQMYAHAGVDFDASWSACPIADSIRRIVQLFSVPGIALVAEKPEARINRKHVTEIDLMEGGSPTSGLLGKMGDYPISAYAEALGSAGEIHTVNSAFLHLADRIPTTGKLFFHRYARAPLESAWDLPTLRKPWIVLE